MKAIVLPDYNKNLIRALLTLKVEERPVKTPGPDEVTIKMYAAPVNPSDIAFLQGEYNIVKPVPTVPGFEGAGEVVDAGENARHLLGKKVSCFVQEDGDGTWAEYVTTHKNNVIVLQTEMDMDQAACFTVNPFTAYGLLEELQPEAGQAVIVNAAGGQVPQFVRALAKEKSVETINIVRKESTAARLKEKGCRYVLVETADHFEEQLQQYANRLNVAGALDAVAGEMTGKIFNTLPDGARLILYGGLSNKPVSGLDNLRIIFNKNRISGFSLPDWMLKMRNENRLDEITRFLQQQITEGLLKTEIRGTIPAEKVIKGIRDYISDMSAGKMLIKF